MSDRAQKSLKTKEGTLTWSISHIKVANATQRQAWVEFHSNPVSFQQITQGGDLFCDSSNCKSPILSCLGIQWILIVSGKSLNDDRASRRTASRYQVILATCLTSAKGVWLILSHSSKRHSPVWQEGMPAGGGWVTWHFQSGSRGQQVCVLSSCYSVRDPSLEQYCFHSCGLFPPHLTHLNHRHSQSTVSMVIISPINLTIYIDDHNDSWLIDDRW